MTLVSIMESFSLGCSKGMMELVEKNNYNEETLEKLKESSLFMHGFIMSSLLLNWHFLKYDNSEKRKILYYFYGFTGMLLPVGDKYEHDLKYIFQCGYEETGCFSSKDYHKSPDLTNYASWSEKQREELWHWKDLGGYEFIQYKLWLVNQKEHNMPTLRLHKYLNGKTIEKLDEEDEIYTEKEKSLSFKKVKENDNSENELITKMKQVNELREKDFITEEEFLKKKAELLDRI